MVVDDVELVVGGDFTAEDVEHIARFLRVHQPQIHLQVGQVAHRAHAFETPEILVAGAAIAEVLGFLVGLWRWRKAGASPSEEEAKSRLQRELETSGVVGMEVSRVEMGSVTATRILLHDVPEHTWIEVETKDGASVMVRFKSEP